MENLSGYLESGIENILKRLMKFSVGNIKEASFAAQFAPAAGKAGQKREKLLADGHSIPPFLIASITKSCNLFCNGCYARELKRVGCEPELTCEKWSEIFDEAQLLGISFILLAGGEPLLRRDVLETAAKYKNILFPVFTNGTMLDDSYMRLFDKHRNLVPVFSIEGERMQTDSRRGEHIFDALMSKMDLLQKKGIPFGASVTVTTDNLRLVTQDSYIKNLRNKGCAVVFYVEYVPVTKQTENLVLDDADMANLEISVDTLRAAYRDMIFLSFPGDEKHMGGCLAAGRGFFHISATGNAEPCPFSPYSDLNLKECTIKEALRSPLFQKLRETGIMTDGHNGGCTLFAKRNEVKAMTAMEV